MCLLCVISRWSRRVATMLPWLVIPFIIVWALSQFLPPSYRLEVTSSRLACLGVLLCSLVWYELLMPWLSSWRARRSALMRERKLIEAQEAAKMRKEATRKCRNCLTAYKVQTPGSGKFTCTYCGHVSKRPYLEVTGSLCSSRSGVCASGQLKGSPKCTRVTKCAWFGENGMETCGSGQSFPRAFMSLLRISSFVGEKILGVQQLSSDGTRGSHYGSEELEDSHASRSEKARRKAKERRQARIEREKIEAEERQQREEVAQLIEQRRRQRDQELEMAKERDKESTTEREKEIRRTRENDRRQKDKGKARLPDKNPEVHKKETNDTPKKETSGNDNKTNNLMGTSSQFIGALKTIKSTRSFTEEHILRYRNFSGILKNNTASGQRPSFYLSKTGVPSQSRAWRSRKDSSNMVGKMPNPSPTLPTRSSSSSKSAKNDLPTVSAWKRAPWSSILVEGNKAKSTELSIRQGQVLHQNLDGENRPLNKDDAVIKSSLSSVRGTIVQPPIAPPVTHIDPLQQIFATPSIFPPIDIPVDLNNHLERDMKHVFLPNHSFFETQASSCVPSLHLFTEKVPNCFQPSSVDSDGRFTEPMEFISQQCSPQSSMVPDYVTALHESSLTSSHKMKSEDAPCILVEKECVQHPILAPILLEEESTQLPSLSTVQSLFGSEVLRSDGSLVVPEKDVTSKKDDQQLGSVRKCFWTEFSSFDSALRIWDDTEGSQKVPPEFVDCITQEIMEDPVITADGHSYERSAIEKWLLHHDTSPKTGEVLPPPPGGVGVDKTLRPNHILRGQIIEYKERLTRMSDQTAIAWSSGDTSNLFKATGSPSVLSF